VLPRSRPSPAHSPTYSAPPRWIIVEAAEK
jgi:hypothetical protein